MCSAQINILPRHRLFLRFAFEGQAYQYVVPPFGLALSPHLFTKVVEAEADLVPLWEHGICILKASPKTLSSSSTADVDASV